MATELKPIGNLPAADACCAPAPPGGAPRKRTALMIGSAAALAAIFALYLLVPDTKYLAGEISRNFFFILKAFKNIWPYMLVSIAASAWVTVAGLSDKIKGVFVHREAYAVAGAAAVGATIPICSCGVIPLIAGMLASGVPFGPIMAFWISAPLMSPEKFILTAGVLGTHYAVARILAAVVLGAGAGYMVSWLAARGRLEGQLREAAMPGGACCAAPEAEKPAFSYKRFGIEAGKMTLFLGKWLSLAFLLEALIVHYLDPAWIAAALGGDQPFAIPLATAIGIPLYTSGVAAIPITEGLLASGMSPGAALAFLIAGPVTTIPAMLAVWALVKRRLFGIYLGAGIAGSLAAGYLFQAAFG
jgi:uncharacterized membrane protein YraQ (UPF0718 family)